jgi:organic hydroperoxide reductase OsmC/OhrA
MGGTGQGQNPEQLFAMGYSGLFLTSSIYEHIISTPNHQLVFWGLFKP